MAAHMERFDDEGGEASERMATMFGPGHIDTSIRQAIQFCWMSLPKDKRTVDELEQQIRRFVDRALKDFREDRQAFGKP
jgi:hypothetical protein